MIFFGKQLKKNNKHLKNSRPLSILHFWMLKLHVFPEI